MALWGRLVVLLVIAAGFFTMHGFLAVSAAADTHPTHHGVTSSPGIQAGDAAAGTRLSGTGMSRIGMSGPDYVDAATEVSAGAGTAPEGPEPAGHSDLLEGCVLALVGLGLAGLALLSLRRPWAVNVRNQFGSSYRQAIRPSEARWSPPRVALCVIRV